MEQGQMTFKLHIKFSEFYSEPSDTEGYQREIIKPSLIQARKTLEFLCIWANVNLCSAPVKLSFWGAFQKLCLQPGAVQGIVMPWGVDLVFGHPEHHPTSLSPSIQPVSTAKSYPPAEWHSHPPRCHHRFTTGGTLNVFGHIRGEILKQDGPRGHF